MTVKKKREPSMREMLTVYRTVRGRNADPPDPRFRVRRQFHWRLPEDRPVQKMEVSADNLPKVVDRLFREEL